MAQAPDWDIRFNDLLKELRGRRNYGEMLWIVSCLRKVADGDIFHFVIIGTHWFYEVRDDLVCASGSSRRRVEGNGLRLYLDLEWKVGTPDGEKKFYFSPSYNDEEVASFLIELRRVKNQRIKKTPMNTTQPVPPDSPPAQPEMKKEPWHYLE